MVASSASSENRNDVQEIAIRFSNQPECTSITSIRLIPRPDNHRLLRSWFKNVNLAFHARIKVSFLKCIEKSGRINLAVSQHTQILFIKKLELLVFSSQLLLETPDAGRV